MTDWTATPPAGPNDALPPIPAWQTKSFWLHLLAMIVAFGTAAGIDVMAIFQAMGLGDSPAAVVATGERAVAAWQFLVATGLHIAGYGQRLAPRFRVVWHRVAGAPKGIR